MNKKYGLSDLEKFNYLRVQLSGEANLATGEFLLSSNNYSKATDTLQEHVGLSHKIITAHMSALLELPQQSNHVDSLKSGFNNRETNIRALVTFGKSKDTFGDLRVLILKNSLMRPNKS